MEISFVWNFSCVHCPSDDGLDEGFGSNCQGYVHGRSLSYAFGERLFSFQTMCLKAEGFLDRVQQWCSY